MNKVFIFLFIISSLCCSQVVGPKISSQQDNFDFGDIPGEGKVTHDFIIYNTGDDALIIKDVRASCGCTAAKPEKNKLLPGESTKINVQFNTFGRTGQQQKYVYISSNDQNTPELRLSFTANIIDVNHLSDKSAGPRLKFDYTSHDFGTVNEGKVVDWTVNFKNVGNKDLEIKNVQTSCGCTAAVVSGKSLKPGETGSLRIEFDSTNKTGKTSKTISVDSNDSEEPLQSIIITADIIKEEK
jgi:hypothetical protein